MYNAGKCVILSIAGGRRITDKGEKTTMTFLLIYLMTLLMAISPVNAGDATAASSGTMRVYDLRVALNGEEYELDVEALADYRMDGNASLAAFWLDLEGEKLFPGRFLRNAEGSFFQLDGMSKSLRAGNDLASELLASAPMEDVSDEGALLTYTEGARELEESWRELVDLCARKGEEAWRAELAFLKDVPDRGTPEEAEVLLPGGLVTEGTRYEYTITREDIADMLEALYASDGEFSRAICRYLNAMTRVTGVDDLIAVIRDPQDLDLLIAVTEYEGQDFELMEAEITVTEDGVTQTIPIRTLRQGDSRSAELTLDQDGTILRVASETTVSEPDENGKIDFGFSLRLEFGFGEDPDEDTDAGEQPDMMFTFACGGEMVENDRLGSDFSICLEANSDILQITGKAKIDEKADPAIEPPMEESVSILDLTDSGVLEEIETLILKDAGRLTQSEGIVRLTAAIGALDREAYSSEEPYSIDMGEFQTVKEAEEAFGRKLPFGDDLLGCTLSYACAVYDQYVALCYADPDNQEDWINVDIYPYSRYTLLCHLDGNGDLVTDPEPYYQLFGANEGSYDSISWIQDGLMINVYFYDSVDLKTVNRVIRETGSVLSSQDNQKDKE